jgi:hypothetical protein
MYAPPRHARTHARTDQHEEDDDEEEVDVGEAAELLEKGLGDEAQERVLGGADGVVAEGQPVVVVPVLPWLGERHLWAEGAEGAWVGAGEASTIRLRSDGTADRFGLLSA